MAQPTFATAVHLLREALKRPTVELDDPVAELERAIHDADRWHLVVEATIRHMSQDERVSLIALQARAAAAIATQIDPERLDLMLAMMAGEADADR